MKRTLFLLLAIAATALPAQAERLWLVIAASDATPAGIADKAKGLGERKGIVVQSADCGDTSNAYAFAAKIETTKEAADAALKTIRKVVKDAYLKSCDVKPGSLLSYRMPAVDPSIADVPASAVNWSDQDRISTVEALPEGRAFVVIRYYQPAKDDPLEGRRERVMLVDPPQKPHELEKSCPDASKATTKDGYLAFQCAREQAGDHLMHSVLLFDKKGRKRQEFSRCRNPSFANGYLYCDAESVRADGSLALTSVKHRLGR